MTEKQSGLALLSRATRIPPDELLAIHQKVKENNDRLNSCARHAFEPIEPGRLLSRQRCANCAGEVDSSAAHWYGRGMAHASAP
ncbi:hypothetical protein POK33_38290 [Burkholderia cenocepacia]|uniref:hypothetical protein n=1 Tax=Burkholderia cenocepacia TaxID=95486 RepID=UPI0023B89B1E|nr:hypothetical protein [Burkholderia cenocepacia]MDF0506606.1 hypothetical protein [Burkholderia cenocepacia]